MVQVGTKAMIGHDPGAPLPWSVDVRFDLSRVELEDWCCENLGPRVRPVVGWRWRPDGGDGNLGVSRWLFRHEEDAAWFGMVWA
jgi:hypothetical protein